MSDDLVERLRVRGLTRRMDHTEEDCRAFDAMLEAADEIEQLREQSIKDFDRADTLHSIAQRLAEGMQHIAWMCAGDTSQEQLNIIAKYARDKFDDASAALNLLPDEVDHD